MPIAMRIIGALMLAAALGACSAVKLGYNALDDVAYWWLDGHLSLAESQATQAREDLARLHAWHRAQELPRLAELLARMEQLAPGPVTAAQACAFVPDLLLRLHAVADRAEPSAVTTALGLAPRQLRQLQRKFSETNRTWRKEWIDLPEHERKDKRFRQLLDRLEMVYGRLDQPQRAALRAGVERSIFDPQRMLLERQRRQQDLQQVLRGLAGSHAAFADARLALRGYLERALHSPDPAYRAYQQALLDEGCRMLATVHGSTNAAQREEAVRRLRAWQRDLRELSVAQP